jgi:hypothetical protein
MSTMESADAYFGSIAQLNADWRVVECRDRLQWILQHRGSPKKPRRNDWRGRSYCRTGEALRRCARDYAGVIDPTAAAILAALPPLVGRSPAGNEQGNLATKTRVRRNAPATASLKPGEPALKGKRARPSRGRARKTNGAGRRSHGSDANISMMACLLWGAIRDKARSERCEG